MSYMLQVDFPYAGPWGEAMAEAMKGLAHSIAEELTGTICPECLCGKHGEGFCGWK